MRLYYWIDWLSIQSRCPICQDALVRRHEGLVHVVLRRQRRGDVACEDLLQEGRIALWQAVLHFHHLTTLPWSQLVATQDVPPDTLAALPGPLLSSSSRPQHQLFALVGPRYSPRTCCQLVQPILLLLVPSMSHYVLYRVIWLVAESQAMGRLTSFYRCAILCAGWREGSDKREARCGFLT